MSHEAGQSCGIGDSQCIRFMDPRELKKGFDLLEKEEFREKRIASDPLEFPHRYSDPRDAEVSGFIASSLAYGRIVLFGSVLERLFSKMGDSPYLYLLRFDPKKALKDFRGIDYRFSSEKDLQAYLFLIHRVLKKRGSLEGLFADHYQPGSGDLQKALSGFVGEFYEEDLSPVYGKHLLPQGLTHLVPHPGRGGASKRLNLFLRWMVRHGGGDLGIWKKVSPAHLVIPLDTHVVRISRKIGLTRRSTPDWKMAREITDGLKTMDAKDPVRFDFILCHLGVSGRCPAVSRRSSCGVCPLQKGCDTGASFLGRDHRPVIPT